MEGNPKFEASQDIPDAGVRRHLCGLSGPIGIVLEVKTDPEGAPLPPHVTLKEARSFMSAMAKGDRGAGRVIGDTARQVVDGLFGKKE
jgi:pyruvate dehydrogenase (quinone)